MTVAPSSARPGRVPGALRVLYRAVTALILLAPPHSHEIDAFTIGARRVTAAAPTSLQATASRRDWVLSIAAATPTLLPRRAKASATTVLVPNMNPVRASLCDQAVSVLTLGGSSVRLVGTAHISADSAVLVGDLVRSVRPDAVFIELDAKRVGGYVTVPAQTLEGGQGVSTAGTVGSRSSEGAAGKVTISQGIPAGPEAYGVEAGEAAVAERGMVRRPGIFSAIRAGFANRLASLVRAVESAAVGSALKSMYDQADKMGFSSGEEFRVAMDVGNEIGARIVLGDRDVQVTLDRLAGAIERTDWSRIAALESDESLAGLGGVGANMATSPDELGKDELSRVVETLKTRDNVRTMMSVVKKEMPELYTALVAERDQYMAEGLDALGRDKSPRGAENVVAVMGMAHMDGVESSLIARGWKKVRNSFC